MTTSRTGQTSVSRSVSVKATPEELFEILADARRHPEVDGSGSVKSAVKAPARLSAGAKFGMKMHLLVPYRMTNTVVEFQEGRRIGWQHVGHHVWRWEFEAVEGGTRVTETFDWSRARSARVLAATHSIERNTISLEKSLALLVDRFGAV